MQNKTLFYIIIDLSLKKFIMFFKFIYNYLVLMSDTENEPFLTVRNHGAIVKIVFNNFL